jgi:hypothetical protein
VTGGVEASDSFLKKFFPGTYEAKEANANNYSP